jgi:hypothetical protein
LALCSCGRVLGRCGAACLCHLELLCSVRCVLTLIARHFLSGRRVCWQRAFGLHDKQHRACARRREW